MSNNKEELTKELELINNTSSEFSEEDKEKIFNLKADDLIKSNIALTSAYTIFAYLNSMISKYQELLDYTIQVPTCMLESLLFTLDNIHIFIKY